VERKKTKLSWTNPAKPIRIMRSAGPEGPAASDSRHEPRSTASPTSQAQVQRMARSVRSTRPGRRAKTMSDEALAFALIATGLGALGIRRVF
jgi:hypothetical protein